LSDAPRNVIEVSKDFWNIRGSYKIRGVVDIGTHASLVRRASGKLVLLDACGLSDDAREWMKRLTRDGEDLEAVLHLHPFHTVHVRAANALFPQAKLYGTARHVSMFGDLPWESLRTEDAELHRAFADDLEFSVPRGVDFVSRDPNLHFASVLAVHRASKTLHVDDTLIYMRLPLLFRLFGVDVTRLHPTLAKVLEPRPDAVSEFRAWTRELLELVEGVDNLCAAHSATLLARKNKGDSVRARVGAAVEKAEGVLAAHARKHSR
jgi:hypothetical protein